MIKKEAGGFMSTQIIDPLTNTCNQDMIRLVTTTDLSRVAEILVFTKRMTYRHLFNNDHASFNQLQVVSLYETLKHTKQDYLYVYDDGIIKGMLRLMPYNDYLEIKELYVDSFFQHQGIGKQLILFAKKVATQLNKNKLTLSVLEKNHHACVFYASQGFIRGQCYIDQETQQNHLQYWFKFDSQSI